MSPISSTNSATDGDDADDFDSAALSEVHLWEMEQLSIIHPFRLLDSLEFN